MVKKDLIHRTGEIEKGVEIEIGIVTAIVRETGTVIGIVIEIETATEEIDRDLLNIVEGIQEVRIDLGKLGK